MVRGLRRAALAVAVVCAVVSTTGAGAAIRGKLLEGVFHSSALRGQVGFEIYLPPGYAHSGARYPVVYFLHGLPASSRSFHGAAAFAEALESARKPAILVGPQGARDSDSDPEYLDWGTGRNWETALGKELPRYVDHHYRTIARRRGRALVGLSAGGYGAVLVALHRLSAFSVMESWSGYFHPTNPDGSKALDLGSTAANRHASAHAFVRSLRHTFARRPTFFAFYVGARDSRFLAENLQLHRELKAAKVPHIFEVYGGGHSQSLWLRHATPWLRLALDHLASAR
ncbi:MAG: alpha/beta hydrolase [Gaiellaceae bacterium]